MRHPSCRSRGDVIFAAWSTFFPTGDWVKQDHRYRTFGVLGEGREGGKRGAVSITKGKNFRFDSTLLKRGAVSITKGKNFITKGKTFDLIHNREYPILFLKNITVRMIAPTTLKIKYVMEKPIQPASVFRRQLQSSSSVDLVPITPPMMDSIRIPTAPRIIHVFLCGLP